MALSNESKRGSDCNGSDAATSRVLTLANTATTESGGFAVYVNGLLLTLTTEYTVSHLSSSSTVTFVNAVYNTDYITVMYNQVGAAGTATYTSSTKVAAFLGLAAFDSSSVPTSTQVEQFITRAEDYIDQKTGHAWRAVTVTTEYYDNPGHYIDGFLKVKMRHRKIRTLATGSGDKVEVWDGSSWVDWVTTKTEGRANDFWVDYTRGILYLKSLTGYSRSFIRLTYRYGESSVAGDIEKAATILAAIDVVSTSERTIARPDVDSPDLAASWKMMADDILSNRFEVRVL